MVEDYKFPIVGGMKDSFNELDRGALECMQAGYPVDSMVVQSFYERKRNCRKWIQDLPFLKFKEDWEIKIIPPTTTALIRFQVRKKDAWVSVYFDSDCRLGFSPEPYWEIYPVGNDAERYVLGEEDELLEGIEKALNEQLNKEIK